MYIGRFPSVASLTPWNSHVRLSHATQNTVQNSFYSFADPLVVKIYTFDVQQEYIKAFHFYVALIPSTGQYESIAGVNLARKVREAHNNHQDHTV